MDKDKKITCFLCKKPYNWTNKNPYKWTASPIEIAMRCHLECASVERQIEKAQQKLTDLEYKKFLICQK